MSSFIKFLIQKRLFCLILWILFFTGFVTVSVNAGDWKNINQKGFVYIPPINLDAPYPVNGALRSYFDFYDLNRPAVKHYFGSFQSNGYSIAAHIFMPENYKATLFLLHGYFDHTGILKDTIYFFVKKGYAVAIYDMPGHGLSSGERISIENFKIYTSILNDFAALYKSQIPGQMHIIAHSTGCVAVVDFILTSRYNLFNKVILIAPLVRSNYWYFSKAGAFLCRPFFNSVPRIFTKNSSNTNFLQFVKNKDPLQYKKIPLQWVNALFEWNKLFQDYQVSSKKVFIIQGNLDKTVTWKHNLKVLMQKFPNGKSKIIENGRHHLLNEESEMQKMIFELILNNIMDN